MHHFAIDLTQNHIKTSSMNCPYEKESMDMHQSITVSKISNISKYGTFWPLLATFGIEIDSMITLPNFGNLIVAENMCHDRKTIPKLKIS